MNWPSKAKETTLLPSSEQIGAADKDVGEAAATKERFCHWCYNLCTAFYTCGVMNLCIRVCVVNVITITIHVFLFYKFLFYNLYIHLLICNNLMFTIGFAPPHMYSDSCLSFSFITWHLLSYNPNLCLITGDEYLHDVLWLPCVGGMLYRHLNSHSGKINTARL